MLVGALSADNWVDAQQTDRKFFTLSFFSLVIAPILGGGILMYGASPTWATLIKVLKN